MLEKTKKKEQKALGKAARLVAQGLLVKELQQKAMKVYKTEVASLTKIKSDWLLVEDIITLAKKLKKKMQIRKTIHEKVNKKVKNKVQDKQQVVNSEDSQDCSCLYEVDRQKRQKRHGKSSEGCLQAAIHTCLQQQNLFVED